MPAPKLHQKGAGANGADQHSCARACLCVARVCARTGVWRGRALRPEAGLRGESGSWTYQAARGRAPQCRSRGRPLHTAFEPWRPSRQKTLGLPNPSRAARACWRPLWLPSPSLRGLREREDAQTTALVPSLSLGSSFLPSKGISSEEGALRETAQPSVA